MMTRPAHWAFTLYFVLLAVPATLADAADGIVQESQSGPVEVRLSLSPETPVIGDTLTLSIEVTAEKDVEVLMPDFGDALDRFSIVDFAPRESIDDQGRTIAKQTYRLDPPFSGQMVIPPILIEYVDRRDGKREAPEGLDAYEILTDRIPFQVASVLPVDAASDLKPPLGKLDPIEPPAPARWPWAIAFAVILLALVPFLFKWLAAARRRRRRRSAYDVAKTRLEKILGAPRGTSEQIDAFYVALSFIIRQYIEDRFEMRAPELTTEEFLASIGGSPDFSTDHQGLLRQFLRQADLVKFAGAVPNSSEIEKAIGNVEQFLEETRENAPLVLDETVDDRDDSGDSLNRDNGTERASEQREPRQPKTLEVADG